MIRILITFLFVINFSFAEVETELSLSQKILSKLSKLQALTGKEKLSVVEESLSSVSKLFNKKKRICMGEFATYVFNETNSNETVKPVLKKLNRKERKVCLQELKSYKRKYIEISYGLKKRIVTHIHTLQLESIEKQKKKSLLNLSKSLR